jgi:hypothetical protein
MEVDGMGVTVTDLTGDGTLDGYVSDLGGNEILKRVSAGFEVDTESGASRIRPPGADDGIVSNSWRSGVVDVNLDGILDIVVVNGGMPFSRVANKISGTQIEVDDPPAILIRLGDGTCADVWRSDTIDWAGAGRDLALGDIDNDGDTDMVTTRLDDSPVLLLNDCAAPAMTVRGLASDAHHMDSRIGRHDTWHGYSASLRRQLCGGPHSRRVHWAGRTRLRDHRRVAGTGVARAVVPARNRPTVTVDCMG